MIYYAIIFSFLNLLLSLWQVFNTYQKNSPSIVFWLVSIYWAGIPLFLDSFISIIGYQYEWEGLLKDGVFTYDLDPTMLLRTSLFVLLFNLIYVTIWIAALRSRNKLDIKYHLKISLVFFRNYRTKIFYISTMLGWFGAILIYYFGDLTRIVVIQIVPLYLIIQICLLGLGVGAFFSAIYKNWIKLAIIIAPAMISAMITSQRPLLIPPIFGAMYGLFVMQTIKSNSTSNNSFRLLTSVAAAGYLIYYVLYIADYGITGGITEISQYLPYPVRRDCATNVLYYCFSEKHLALGFVPDFSAIKFLLKSGLMPSFIFGNEVQFLDITRRVAIELFNWKLSGTIHPTFYGWAFWDMSWYGIFFGGYLGLFMGIMERWANTNLLRKSFIISIASMLLVVGMRGSVQYAYSRSIYALFILILIDFTLNKFYITTNKRDVPDDISINI